MKISEYNQMMNYLTRREPTKLADSEILKNNINAVPKRDILDHIDQQRHIYEGTPLSEKNKKINAGLAKGGTPKNKTPLATEKNNIVIAMSETPAEEFQLDLSTEIEQFQEWLKKNKNGTYKEYLKDKTALLTDEQKKDPKIIDLEPYLPNFEDVIKEYEKEQEEKKESLNEYIKRRSNEMLLAEANGGGVATLFKKRL